MKNVDDVPLIRGLRELLAGVVLVMVAIVYGIALTCARHPEYMRTFWLIVITLFVIWFFFSEGAAMCSPFSIGLLTDEGH